MSAKDALPTLDLHGKTQDEVFDLVDRFIMRNHGREKVRIMPGKGLGIVQKELVRYLKTAGFPYEHETMPNGAKNTGSFIVFL